MIYSITSTPCNRPQKAVDAALGIGASGPKMLREFESLGPVSQRGRLKRSGLLHLTRVNTGTLPSISVTNATVVGNIFNTPSPARSLLKYGGRQAASGSTHI